MLQEKSDVAKVVLTEKQQCGACIAIIGIVFLLGSLASFIVYAFAYQQWETNKQFGRYACDVGGVCTWTTFANAVGKTVTQYACDYGSNGTDLDHTYLRMQCLPMTYVDQFELERLMFRDGAWTGTWLFGAIGACFVFASCAFT